MISETHFHESVHQLSTITILYLCDLKFLDDIHHDELLLNYILSLTLNLAPPSSESL